MESNLFPGLTRDKKWLYSNNLKFDGKILKVSQIIPFVHVVPNNRAVFTPEFGSSLQIPIETGRTKKYMTLL
jgi:hypothetical protein